MANLPISEGFFYFNNGSDDEMKLLLLSVKVLSGMLTNELPLLLTKPIHQRRDAAEVCVIKTGPPFSLTRVVSCFLTMAVQAAIVTVDVTTSPTSQTA